MRAILAACSLVDSREDETIITPLSSEAVRHLCLRGTEYHLGKTRSAVGGAKSCCNPSV